MAKRVEEVVLDLGIEQKDAFSELEKLKKNIIGLKEESKNLSKAYKEGNITLNEYVKGTTLLEAKLKQSTATYNNVQKSVTGVKTQIDKLVDSNKKISSSFQDTANQINIAGVNVGSLTTKMASFLNPTTAAIGILSTLGAAYARSTVGAKDLEFAQDQLGISTTILTNKFAALISSGEDGEGFFTRVLNKLPDFALFQPALLALKTIGIDIKGVVEDSKKLAKANQELEDLQREEINLMSNRSELQSENAELLTKIQSDQTKYNEKLKLSNKIIENIGKSELELTNNKAAQLAIVEQALKVDEHNEDLQRKRNQLARELTTIDKQATKEKEKQQRILDNLVESEAKRLKTAEDNKVTGGRKLQIILPKEEEFEAVQQQEEFNQLLLDTTVAMGGKQIELHTLTEEEKTEITRRETEKRIQESKRSTQIQLAEDQAKLESASMVLGALSGLFKQGTAAQKTAALLSIGADTAAAIASAVKAAEGNPLNSTSFGLAGALQFAASLARIITNIAMAKKYLSGSAAGGGNFLTKGPATILVGDNPGGVERVTVEPISGRGQTKVYPDSNLIAMAGGGTVSPAGIAATKALTSAVNMSFRGSQNQNPIYVSWAEGQRMSDMVAFKEKLTTA